MWGVGKARRVHCMAFDKDCCRGRGAGHALKKDAKLP